MSLKGLQIIFKKEFKSFLGSGKGILFIYLFLILLWSLMFITTDLNASVPVLVIWLLTLSVIIGGNFSQNVFVAERITGSIEILLTMGLSRLEILVAKTLFVTVMTTILGFACMGISMLWAVFGKTQAIEMISFNAIPFTYSDFLLFAVASFFNAASAAWLSIRLSNPRMLYFVNLGIMAALFAAYFLLTTYLQLHIFVFLAVLLLGGVFLFILAKESFEGEKVIQPVS
jgi:ABC-type Na+ efflux pump permease subunit